MVFNFIMCAYSNPSLNDDWLATLQDSGYRITNPLKVVVKILADSTRALGPVEIFDLGRLEYPKIGLVTVYRSIDKLLNLGLVQRIHQEDGCQAFLRATQGHEHILLCKRCGKGVYFEGDDLTNLIERVERKSGFTIQDHWLQLHGICANCQSST